MCINQLGSYINIISITTVKYAKALVDQPKNLFAFFCPMVGNQTPDETNMQHKPLTYLQVHI